jgi:hypothetical protein
MPSLNFLFSSVISLAAVLAKSFRLSIFDICSSDKDSYIKLPLSIKSESFCSTVLIFCSIPFLDVGSVMPV